MTTTTGNLRNFMYVPQKTPWAADGCLGIFFILQWITMCKMRIAKDMK